MSLIQFLEEKPLYYKKIDYTRMPRVYEKIKHHFKTAKIIHLIGTNGKGTTGRFLATSLFNMGYKTGHYTSPHILEFNERIWVDGDNTSYDLLDSAHEKLQDILTQEDSASLSFFEYTTFLAMLVFNACDYIILEAGLGGQRDATAVFPKDITLVTPISYDHEAFLGTTIQGIAQEKLNAIQNNAILAFQNYKEVYEVAYSLKEKNIYKLHEYLEVNDIVFSSQIAKDLSLAGYLEENLKLSIACLKFFDLKYEKKDFQNSLLFGRLSKFRENIILDVGHNPLAADSILQALKGQKYILVYNTYEDKEYTKILDILKPIIKWVEIIKITDKRIVKTGEIKRVLTDLKIECYEYKKIQENEKYLVFGSFLVVEEFLKGVDG